jgi:hypothetical protein
VDVVIRELPGRDSNNVFVLDFPDELLSYESCQGPDVAKAGHAWSSSGAKSGQCSLHDHLTMFCCLIGESK